MSKINTNSGKSVRERLLNLSRTEHYNPQMMISRYMQERLLYRLSISNYRERFILKGGVLLYAHDRFEARPTLDIDFMATHINNDKENMTIESTCSRMMRMRWLNSALFVSRSARSSFSTGL